MLPWGQFREIKLKPGNRVRISADYNWAKGALGTIDDPPDFAKKLAEEKYPWVGHRRFTQDVENLIELVWVWFDEPQYDPDGDGPYRGAEFEVDALKVLEKDIVKDR